MELLNAIESRRTVRKFTDEAVSAEVLDKIMYTATQVPSWKNTRTPRFTVITDKALINKIADEAVFGMAHNSGIIKGAPVLVIQSAIKELAGFDPDKTPTTKYGDGYTFFDAGLAAQNISLAACEQGLGSVIMGIIDYDKIAQFISLPADEEIIVAIAIGHPESTPSSPKKYSVSEIVRYI